MYSDGIFCRSRTLKKVNLFTILMYDKYATIAMYRLVARLRQVVAAKNVLKRKSVGGW